MSDTEKNYPGSERKEGGKKKDGKKDKKEKGYVMFDADASDEDLVAGEDLKSPSKMKKGKAFRFGSKKDIFPKVKGSDDKKEGKKEEKEKRKGEKKHKIKGKKKSKHDLTSPAVPEVIDQPVFGVPLTVAIERNRSHDGIQLPALFRECIDYIEEHGLHCEGIYRISGVKSKVQHLKDLYNRGEQVYLAEHEPNIVAGVLKQFLRELPEPVLTNALIPKFEEASTIRNERRRIESFLKLIRELPQCNGLLLSWMIVHMTHVIERQKENKMTLQNVSIVLSPTMQISHRVLNVLFSHTKQLFTHTVIKRYVPPLKPATSRWSLELPDNPQALQEELQKQESLLSQLHEELAAGKADTEKEEQIWEVQRVCTQLKRKIKLAQKNVDTLEKRKRERDEQSKRNTVLEEGEEELRLELRDPPGTEVLRLELRAPAEKTTQPEHVDIEHDESQGGEITPTAETKDQIEAKNSENEACKPQIETEAEDTNKDATETKQKVTLKELATQSKAMKAGSEEKDKKVDTENSEDLNAKSTESESVSEIEHADGTVIHAEEEVTETVKTVNDEEMKTEMDECIETQKPVNKTVISVEEDTAGVEGDAAGMEGDTSVEGDQSVVEEDMAETEGTVEETRDITAEDVKADLMKKQAMMLQEDTTDSELGHSHESIHKEESESDEFEHSLDEILERDLNVDSDRDVLERGLSVDSDRDVLERDLNVDSDRDVINDEVTEEITGKVDEETEEVLEEIISDDTVAMETKTPVPVETPESPPTTTPVPQQLEVDDSQETELNTSGEVQTGTESAVELEMSEMSEMSEDETVTEEEFHKLLEEEYLLKLEEEELLTIESELRKKIETERCESERLQQEIDELHYLRQDSDEEILSTSSDSSYESEDEDDLQEILQQLIKENEGLEKENSEMCSNIHRERMICLEVKLQIGILQQKQAQHAHKYDTSNEKDMLIEFD